MDSRLLGRFGEERAAALLRKKGYEILAMNYRTRLGEIDVIAQNRRFLVFAEVKLRRDAAFAAGREFVSRPKQRRIALAAESYLLANPNPRQPRFDVIEIYAPHGAAGELDITHLEDAFQLD